MRFPTSSVLLSPNIVCILQGARERFAYSVIQSMEFKKEIAYYFNDYDGEICLHLETYYREPYQFYKSIMGATLENSLRSTGLSHNSYDYNL